MEVGLYHSAAALQALSRDIDVVAHNLANVSTTGFKRHLTVHESFSRSMQIAGQRFAVPKHRELIDFSPGPVVTTGNPNDLAVAGRGFFRLETPGGPRYARSLTIVPGPDGTLTTPTGERLATSGSLPHGDVPITVDGQGIVSQNGADTGLRIRLVDFDDFSRLRPAGQGSFSGDPALERPSAATIRQGALEQSNSSTVDALVSLVTLTRAFESSSRAMRTMDESVQRATTAL